ncbi:hypothetical protein ALO43_200431 [Pseudomonas tremae]|uniref:DEAD/DEAH box helicase n=1 Tax=Pseudomonas tremae TaxID=200454 RepID=A0AA40NYY3_9PSED|nr:hypothetical protein ALO43_200431 [Pseudomonas tremae]
MICKSCLQPDNTRLSVMRQTRLPASVLMSWKRASLPLKSALPDWSDARRARPTLCAGHHYPALANAAAC